MGNARARKIPAQLVEDEEYQLRYERVAGIDVAKAKADVCTRLPPAREGGRRASRVEEVPATAREILALAARLLADGVELVVMESTSDYWRIWYYLLEAAGLNVQLANPAHARQLAGRPKTDRLDAQWIARLAEMGLLRPSFVPPPEIRALRDLTRTRLQLVRDRTREWQRLEKLLEGALVKLSSVVSLAGQDEDRPRHPGGDRRRRARPAGPGRPGRRAGQGRARRHRAGPGRHATGRSPPPADPDPPGPHHAPGPSSPPSRTRSRPPWTRSPPPGASTPTACPGRTPAGPDAAVLPAAERLAEIPGVSPEAGQGDHRRNRPGHDPVPDRRPPGLLGRAGPRRPPVRAPEPQAEEGTGRRLPEGLLHPGRQRRRPTPTPSSANGSAACPGASAGTGPSAPSAGPSSSSSGTCWPTPRPGSPTSAPAGTPARPTATARSAATSASSRPSASTSTITPAAA